MTALIPEMCRRSLAAYTDGSGDIFISVDDNQASVWIPDGGRPAIVAVRGSELSLKDWVRNLDYRMVDPGVHRGFVTAATALLPEIKKAVGYRKVVFTGHSQGGAVASVLAALMASQVEKLVTFGSPRVFSRSLAHRAALQFHHIRVVDSNDIVPRVPPFWRGYSHFGQLKYITQDGDVLDRPSVLRVTIERIIGFRFDLLRDHLLKSTLPRLEAFYERGLINDEGGPSFDDGTSSRPSDG